MPISRPRNTQHGATDEEEGLEDDFNTASDPCAISMAAFAKHMGMARSTITRAVRGPLKSALTANERINIDHPTVERWLTERGKSRAVFGVSVPPKRAEGRRAIPSNAISLDDVERLTLRELGEQFGSDESYYLWVRAKKETAMARKAELMNERTQRQVIPVTMVQYLFSHIDTLHRLLLSDMPKTVASTLVKGRNTIEEGQKLIHDEVSKNLKVALRQMQRALKSDDPHAQLSDPAPLPPPKDNSARERNREVQRVRDHVVGAASVKIAEFFTKENSPRDPETVQRMAGNILNALFDEAKQELNNEFTTAELSS